MRLLNALRFRSMRCAAILVLAAAPWLAGCGGEEGPPRAAANGIVTLDGQPLAEGVIRFIPAGETKGPAVMALIQGGKNELGPDEGPVIGAQRVEIEATGHHGFAIDDEAAYAANVEQKGGRMASNPVPIIYNRRSTLTAQIAADHANEVNFQLSSAAGQTAQR